MLKPLIVGNWKMHGSAVRAEQLLAAISSSLNSFGENRAQVLLCPPVLYLERAAQLLANSTIALAAQNLCGEEVQQGAYTGEISAQMLADIGCSYVLVGHSERRRYYAESDRQVAQKALNALQQDLVPIVCVGETLEQRQMQQSLAVVESQLHVVLEKIGAQPLVVAYEPVWAIGTGLSATAEQAQEMHANIRNILQAHYAAHGQQAHTMHIIYGGSVNPSNAGALLAQQDVNGVLVGGASLVSEDFLNIIRAA